jgi:hypothetical protein
VGDDPGRVGKKQPRSVSGGLADSPGVGVQPLGHLPRQCLWPDAVAARGGQVDGARGGNQPLSDLPTLRPGHQHPPGNPLSAQDPGQVRRRNGVRPGGLRRRRRARCATGRPPAPTRAWTSLWSPFHLPRPASTSRRSCATYETYRAIDAVCRSSGQGAVQGRPDR